jgi:hypothetical protein
MKPGIRKALIMATVVSTAALAIGPASAGAGPAEAKNSQKLSLHCTKLGDVDVILNGKGTWTPGHVVGSTRVLKPYEIHITGTFTPTGGSPEPITQDSVKAAPKSRKLDECSFHQEGTDADGTSSIDGTVKVQYSGKRIP